jgi:hypothetical protein
MELCVMKKELLVSDLETLRRYQRNVTGKNYVEVTSLLI